MIGLRNIDMQHPLGEPLKVQVTYSVSDDISSRRKTTTVLKPEDAKQEEQKNDHKHNK